LADKIEGSSLVAPCPPQTGSCGGAPSPATPFRCAAGRAQGRAALFGRPSPTAEGRARVALRVGPVLNAEGEPGPALPAQAPAGWRAPRCQLARPTGQLVPPTGREVRWVPAFGCPGRSLLYEVQNHVRPNFATPMLYAKNHSKFHNFFCTAIKALELYFVHF
jgi:hypothetical protein